VTLRGGVLSLLVRGSLMSTLHPLKNPFVYSTANVRTATDESNQVWFCAKDVCQILGIKNHLDAVSKLDEDELKGVGDTDTLGGKQTLNFVSESGLYALIFKSNKPEAVTFRKWVTKEVLPAIRRQGFYGQLNAGNQIALRYQKIKLLEMLAKTPSQFVSESIKTSLSIVTTQLGEPAPNYSLLPHQGQ
jgi:prophage antirepressor-like protein